MTETTPPNEAQVALAFYDRMLAETRKFSAEQNKLAAEQNKRVGKARKFDLERWAVNAAAIVGLIGGAAGIVSLVKMLH